MKTYAVKTGADAKPVGIDCNSIVLRDDHVTFYGVPTADPEVGTEMRVALARGWYIHEIYPVLEPKKISIAENKIIVLQ